MAKPDSWATMNGATRVLDAQDARIGISALWTPGSSAVNARGGRRPGPGDTFKVAATGTPGANVTVQAGQLIIPASRGNGAYHTTSDAVDTIAILDVPADPSLQRNDLVVARQSDTYYTDASTAFTIARVLGTPGAGDPSPTAGGLSPDYVLLARVRVTAGASTITNAMIDDLRPGYTVALGGLLPVGSAAERDALTTYDGRQVWRYDRDWIEVYDGTAWRVEGVAICTSTADRDSAITHPRSGQLAQTTNAPDTLWQYDGSTSAWVQIACVKDPRGILGIVQATGNAPFTGTETLIDSITFTHVQNRYERGKFDSRFSLNTGGVVIMRYRYVSGSGPVANTDTLIYETIPTGSSSNNHMGISKVFPSVFRSLTSGTYTVGVFATAAAGATSGTINGVANGLERDFVIEDAGAP
ncbi:MAG TPA: hypothetical protein VM677_08475 [Actinokineospora sp.]|nr:hypothetical protein [Actinokineospora sp.]